MESNMDIGAGDLEKGSLAQVITAVADKTDVVVDGAKSVLNNAQSHLGNAAGLAGSVATTAATYGVGAALEVGKLVGLKSVGTSLYDSFMGKLKILISAFQIVASFPASLNISFPVSVTKFFNGLSFVNILTVDISSFSCFAGGSLDYVDTMIFYIVTPIMVSFVLFLMWYFEVLYVKHKKDKANQKLVEEFIDDELLATTKTQAAYADTETSKLVVANAVSAAKEIKELTSHYVTLFLLFTYAILTGVSSAIASMIPCTNIDPNNVDSTLGDYYLTADLSIDCEGPRYAYGIAWATLGFVIYPLGIPVSSYIYIYKDV